MSNNSYIMTGSEFIINEEWTKMNEATELSDKQKEYQKLMLFGLHKFDAKSPADLSTDDKKDFFNWIKDNWDKEAGKIKNDDVKKEVDSAVENELIKSPEDAQKK